MLAEWGRLLNYVGTAALLAAAGLHVTGLHPIKGRRDYIRIMVAIVVASAGVLMGGGRLRSPPSP